MCHNTMNHKILQSARQRNLNLSSVENEPLKKKKKALQGLDNNIFHQGLCGIPCGGIVDTQIYFDRRLDSVFRCTDTSGAPLLQSPGTPA